MYKNLYRNTKHKYRKEVIVKYTIKFLNDIEETIDKTQLEQLGGFFSAIVNGNFSEKVTRTIDLTKFGIKKDQFINIDYVKNKPLEMNSIVNASKNIGKKKLKQTRKNIINNVKTGINNSVRNSINGGRRSITKRTEKRLKKINF